MNVILLRRTHRLGRRLASSACAALTVSLLAALAAPSQSLAQTPQPFDLGHLGGRSTVATAAADGYVVGSSLTSIPDGNGGYIGHAYIWSATTHAMTDIGAQIPGSAYSTATSVNSRGEVVGGVYAADGSYAKGYYWSAAGGYRFICDIGNINQSPILINEGGVVAGSDAGGHVFRWTASGGLQDYGVLGDAYSTQVTGINSGGDFVGSTNSLTTGYVVGFVCRASSNTPTILNSPGIPVGQPFGFQNEGGLDLRINGINDSGVVVGTYWDYQYMYEAFVGYFNNFEVHNQHAFKWTAAAGFTDLGKLSSWPLDGISNPTNNPEYRHYGTWASAVTNGGLIVGTGFAGTTGPFPTNAYSYQGTGPIAALPMPSGAYNTSANSVNDDGIIAGDVDGHPTLWQNGAPTDLMPSLSSIAPLNATVSIHQHMVFGNGQSRDTIPPWGFNAGHAWAMSIAAPPPPTAPVTVSAPSFSAPGDITVNATSSSGAVVNFSTPAATSNVSMLLFSRDTAVGETWKSYSSAFTSARTGNFTLGFTLTAPTSGINGSIFVERVKLASGASTLFEDGFEIAGIPNPPRGVSANGGTATFGSWVFNGYSGILQGPDPQDWGLPAIGGSGLGSADGSWQFAYLQQYNGILGNMRTVNTVSVIAGQAYALSFYQASRLYFGAPNTYTVTLNNTESVPVVATPLASGATFPIGTTLVKLTATNSVGVATVRSFNVTVKGTPPVITASSPITAQATGPTGASVTIPATATDYNGASLPISVSPAGPYPIGITQVTLSATDGLGLTTTKQVVVNVIDTLPPAITVPADITVEATAASTPVTFAVSATDLVDGAVTATAAPASGSGFAVGTTKVTVTAQDTRGNAASKSFNVTVTDTTAPTIVTPANITVEATGPSSPVSFVTSATDLVDGNVAVNASQASGSGFPVGTTTVNLSATDAHGNTATSSFTVTVRDTTAPVVASVTPSQATLWPPNHQMVAITLRVAATDLVGVVGYQVSATSSEPDNGLGDGDTPNDIQIAGNGTLNPTVNLRAERSGTGSGRTYTITVKAFDAAGNVSTAKTCTVSVPKSQGGK